MVSIALLALSIAQADLPKYSVPQLQEDLTLMRASLEHGHPGLYRYSSKETIDAAFNNVLGQLDRPMNCLEFYRTVAPIIVQIRCGHTQVSPPIEVFQSAREDVPLLPLRVQVIGSQAFVTHSSSSPDLTGWEIKSINGKSTKDLLSKMDSLTSRDGRGESMVTSRLNTGGRFNLNLWLMLGMSSPYKLELTKGADAKSTTLEGVKGVASIIPAPPDQDEPSGTLKFLNDGRIGVMRISSFNGVGENGAPLDDWYKTAFSELHDHGTKSLIIDVRGNGGGRDDLGKLLFAHLTDKPFNYYKALYLLHREYKFGGVNPPVVEPLPDGMIDGPGTFVTAAIHPNWGIQQPVAPYFDGKVIVLMDGGSFSTTGEFMSIARFHKRATFIGEESGAAFGGNNSGRTAQVNLTNSKLRVFIPLMRYELAVDGQLDRGILPDYPVRATIEDVLSGAERAMELAISKSLP